MAATDVTKWEAPIGGDEKLAVAMSACWKSFGPRIALRPTSFSVAKGSVVVLSGANGAGKSTFLRIATGCLQPSGGRRWLFGTGLYLAAGDGGRAVQTVSQAVRQVAALAAGDSQQALCLAGCGEFADRKVGELSRGQHARLTLAVAAAAAPALLCLDEPAAHLDRCGQSTLWGVVDVLRARGSAVIVATPVAGADIGAWYGLADAHVHIADGRVEAVA